MEDMMSVLQMMVWCDIARSKNNWDMVDWIQQKIAWALMSMHIANGEKGYW
jgi:hypothetical protein